MPTHVEQLADLIETLRSEKGCPWDRKQNTGTMSAYLVEEVYELLEAIESGNSDDILEEMGDVLFQILFLAQLYKEAGHFDLERIAEVNRAKMIHRHPHVFGDAMADTDEEVRRQWREIKRNEKQSPPEASILNSIPRKLPALMRAYRISERAGGWGFDWDDVDGVMEKVEEEWAEFKAEVKRRDENPDSSPEDITLELGDIFFTLVNVGRFLRVHPETALSASTKKFEKRFRNMEQKLAQNQQTPASVSRAQLDLLWEEAKKETD
jgi:tetrapyrrole methylase family protein/MazG family protein